MFKTKYRFRIYIRLKNLKTVIRLQTQSNQQTARAVRFPGIQFIC